MFCYGIDKFLLNKGNIADSTKYSLKCVKWKAGGIFDLASKIQGRGHFSTAGWQWLPLHRGWVERDCFCLALPFLGPAMHTAWRTNAFSRGMSNPAHYPLWGNGISPLIDLLSAICCGGADNMQGNCRISTIMVAKLPAGPALSTHLSQAVLWDRKGQHKGNALWSSPYLQGDVYLCPNQ